MIKCLQLQYRNYHQEMDAKTAIASEQQGNGFYIAQFKTAELGVYTYYAESKGEALIIDPTYDTRIYKQLIDKRKTKLRYIFLTHYHADFISGHTQFDAPLIMGPKGKRQMNKFQVKEHEDGSSVQVGQIVLKVIHTPGHTQESTCFLLNDSTSTPVCIFTGDTLLVGDVGRSDCLGKEHKLEEEAAVHFDSLQKIKSLDGKVRIYPSHGNGSSCGKNIGTAHFCDIATQKEKNSLFKEENRQDFVKNVCAGVTSPKHFSHVFDINQSGAPSFKQNIEKANHALSVEQFTDLSLKLKVIDSRVQPESIIRGKNIFWLTAKGTLAGWAANIVLHYPDTEYIIFTDVGKWQQTAERLFRLGFFNIKGYNNFSMDEWKGQSRKPKILRFDHLKDIPDITYLDCRNKPEWKSTGIIENAVLIPLPQLQAKALEVKDRKNIVIHCRTGMRARVAASILAQHGIQSSVLFQPIDQFKQKGTAFKMVEFKE